MTLKVATELRKAAPPQAPPRSSMRARGKNNFSARWNRENQGAFIPRNPRGAMPQKAFRLAALAAFAADRVAPGKRPLPRWAVRALHRH
jgi:hypothetical protein